MKKAIILLMLCGTANAASYDLIGKDHGMITSQKTYESLAKCRAAKEEKGAGWTQYFCSKSFPKEKPNQRAVPVEELKISG